MSSKWFNQHKRRRRRKATWWDYEYYKRIIAAKGLTSREYERAILDLTRKLGL